MPKRTNNPNDPHRESVDVTNTGDQAFGLGTWRDEETYWRENYASRPYINRERGFDYYQPGYRYGYESAQRYRDRDWSDVEPELRSGWEKYEHRGKSTWEEIKDSVRDAWDRITGHDERARRR